MNRQGFVTGLMVAVLGSGLLSGNVLAQGSALESEARLAIGVAENEVAAARAAIEQSKQVIDLIPDDSPLMSDVLKVVEAASENWKAAMESLNGAKLSADKISTAANESIGQDLALLAKVNAGVAMSGAKVVQIGAAYIDAIANDKTEALDIIRAAMQDAVAATAQVQLNYDRVKTLVAKKHSK